MNVAIITEHKSDFSKLLEKTGKVEYLKPVLVSHTDLGKYDCFCILGGTSSDPLVLNLEARNAIESERIKGKKIFIEYMLSIGYIYSSEPKTTRFRRLVYCGNQFENLSTGSILDDHCNMFTSPYFKHEDSYPLLVFKDFIPSHKKTQLSRDEMNELSNWALWQLDSNTMICGIRISNFIKARLSPINTWQSIIQLIIEWLTGCKLSSDHFTRGYVTGGGYNGNNFERYAKECVSRGISWFTNSGILQENGAKGVLEGLHHDIDPDGKQKIANTIRADCQGEVSLAYYMHNLLTGDEKSLIISNNLEDLIFNYFQVKEGIFKGMIRWTSIAYGVCYQDDVARAIIPTLLKSFYESNSKHLNDALEALNFLIKTTGSDGLRVSRTDCLYLNENKINQLHSSTANFPCAHYNAYYHAALLIGYKLTGRDNFKEVAVNGLTAIMNTYPDTIREQSETEELCRLVLPLSWLYWVTKDETHKEWLYTVCKDLQKIRKGNSYIEWDTGYKAVRSKKRDSECSMLTENGDMVCDLLYSVNWLPLGFIQAYFVTGDKMFYDLWKDIAVFFINAQIKSSNQLINGAWARGYDLETEEVYGVPYDVGWGPWAVESGWTVGEILSGLALGLIADRFIDLYKD